MAGTGLLVVDWPFVLGCDAGGVVVKTGSKVSNLKVGDEVLGCTRLGVKGHSTCQEYVCETAWCNAINQTDRIQPSSWWMLLLLPQNQRTSRLHKPQPLVSESTWEIFIHHNTPSANSILDCSTWNLQRVGHQASRSIKSSSSIRWMGSSHWRGKQRWKICYPGMTPKQLTPTGF